MNPHRWSFLSHHGMVLVALSRRPDLRLRDLAVETGISPRAVQTIVTDLVQSGFLERARVGRRNRYRVIGTRRLPDQWAEDRLLGDLVRTLARRAASVNSDEARRRALVLACSDHRFQHALRQLLDSIGMDAGAEVVLWPGGSTALTEPGGSVLLELIAAIFEDDPPTRIVLVSHERCHGLTRGPNERDPLDVVAAASRRRRRTVGLVEATFGVRPELWYQTERGARRMGGTGRIGQRMFDRKQVAVAAGRGGAA
jgi:hypothetical protein